MNGLTLKCLNDTCKCLSNQYFMYGCKNKKTDYSQQCMSNSLFCNDNQNLTCLDGICKCQSNSYWNGNISTCVVKTGYGGSCNRNEQCLNTMTCTSSNQCLCGINKYTSIFKLF